MSTQSTAARYRIPARSCQAETEVKKSRFIARAAPCSDRAGALALLEQARADYPDARHHCWAYLLGPADQPHGIAMSDDGEPGGTAGKPILNVMQHQGVGDLMVIVSRYFGGIKLGAGGLVRAYSQATQTVLTQLPTRLLEPRLQCALRSDFAQEQPLRHWAECHGAELMAVDYGQDVRMDFSLPVDALPSLESFVAERGIQLHLGDTETKA